MPTNTYFLYLLRFGASFLVLYLGTLAVIGLSSPDNFYSSFVDGYLNFVDPLRSSLLGGSKVLLGIFGYESFFRDTYTLALDSGEGVRMVYSCIGYGVMSFWAAFVFANRGSWTKKALWITGGLVVLWLLNVLRMTLLILALKHNWSVPFGWDHHTWFNIVAYSAIFALIFLYDRSFPSTQLTNERANTKTQALP